MQTTQEIASDDEQLGAQQSTAEMLIALLQERNLTEACVGTTLAVGDRYEAKLTGDVLSVKHISSRTTFGEYPLLGVSTHIQEASFKPNGDFISGTFAAGSILSLNEQNTGPIELAVARKLLSAVYSEFSTR